MRLLPLLLSLPLSAYAGGITLYEIATPEVRLASAGWSSRAEDPSTVFTNPAGMTRLPCAEMQVGIEAINAKIEFDKSRRTTVAGVNGDASIWLPSGSFFCVTPVNEKFSVGVGSFGYFGSDLHYTDDSWVGRYYVDYAFLEGFSLVGSAAYQMTDSFSFGLGINAMYALFREKNSIRNSLDSLKDGFLKMHDESLAAGAVAGILYQFSPCTRLGIQYLSPIQLHFQDTPTFVGIGPTLENVLRATGVLNSKVQIHARVPQSVMVSLFHAFNSRWSVMVDGGWQQWSQFQKVSVTLASTAANTLTFLPTYQDTWHGALGVEYHPNCEWTLSAGFAYDSSAISDANRTLDFPIGEQWRFGTGGRWQYSDALSFDLCYEMSWSGNLPVDVNKGPLVGHVTGVFANTYVQFFSANLNWAF